MGQVAKVVFAAIAVAGAAIFVSAIKKAADFELAMAKVNAISGATAEEFDALSEKAKQLGLYTAQTMTDIAAGMEAFARAGFTATEIVLAMDGAVALAESQMIDLSEAVRITGAVLNGMNLEASESERVANALAAAASSSATTVDSLGEAMKYMAPVAAALNVPLEEALTIVGKLGDAGLTGGRATRALSTALEGLAAPTEDAATALRELGIEVFDADGNFTGIINLVGQLEGAFNDLGYTAEERMAAMGDIFAGSAGEMNILIGVGVEELERYQESITGTTVAFDQQAAMLDTLKGQWTILKGSIELLLVTIGTDMMPILKSFLQDRIIPLVNKISEWITEMGGLSGVWSAFMAMLERNKVLITVVGAGIAAIVVALNPIPAAIAAVTAALGYLIASWDSVRTFFTNVTDGFLDWGRSIVASVIEGLRGTWDSVVTWFQNAWDGLINALTSWMPGFLRNWLGIGEDSAKEYAAGLEAQKSTAIAAGQELGDATVQGVKMSAAELEQAGSELAESFSGGFTDGVDEGKDSAFSAGSQLGEAAVSGLGFGIDAQSPSEETRALGLDFAKGFEGGIEEGTPAVISAVESMAEMATDTLRSIWEQAKSDTKQALGDMLNNIVTYYQEEESASEEHERTLWEILKEGVRNLLTALREDLLLKAASHLVDAFALAWIPGMQLVAGGHLAAAGIYAAGGAGLAIAGFEKGAVFEKPTMLPPHMVAEGGVAEAYLPLSENVFSKIGQGIVNALTPQQPVLAGAGNISIDMRGMNEGAVFNVRSESDIELIAREHYSLFQSRLRSEGVRL